MNTPIPKHVKQELGLLNRYANGLRGLYGVPIYLVGSALSGTNKNPRDWDIRIILPDDDFTIKFGDVNQWKQEGVTGLWTKLRWNWSDTCVKLSKDGYKQCGLNIDCQIYPQSHSDAVYPKSLPKLKIDTRDDE